MGCACVKNATIPCIEGNTGLFGFLRLAEGPIGLVWVNRMVELTVPEMNESIHADLVRELSRFPYLSDEYRTETGINKMIDSLFNSQTSMAIEYPGGYLILRDIAYDSADLVWIHGMYEPFGAGKVRLAGNILDAAMDLLDIERITMGTPDRRIARLAKHIGFKPFMIDEGGFTWRGIKMPRYRMEKGRT
jgi:hypothetical protein